VRMYGTDRVYLTWTKYFFQISIGLQIILLVLIYFSNQITLLFPVFSDSIATKLFLSAIWVIGLLFALVNLRRLDLIGKNKDKAYQRIKQLEKFV
ncbi:hypothetical protein IAG15_15865, partial [Enterococcus faecalis]|nr:hypothetical protein [Enterococcus faecalis]